MACTRRIRGADDASAAHRRFRPCRETAMSAQPSLFRRFAEATSRHTGRPAAFLLAVAVVAVWALSGPLFHYGDTWQLVINTGTTIVTFLMVFLIQNTQNRDSAALQIKLDELIRATEARNSLLDLENADEETLERLRSAYRKLAHRRQGEAAGEPDRGIGSGHEDQAEEACEEAKEIDRELEQIDKSGPSGDGGGRPS
jgi:low affinity Fe/Cu permease